MYERYEVWDDALDRDPETTQARAQGWERAALIRAQNMFCCQIVSCAKIAQEVTVQSHPTAVDGNLLHENLQIWSSAEELANLRSGYRWFSAARTTTVAGHDSRTSEHVLNHRPRHYHAQSYTLYNSLHQTIKGRVGWPASN